MHSIFEILPGSLKYKTPIIDIAVIQHPVQTGYAMLKGSWLAAIVMQTKDNTKYSISIKEGFNFVKP
ncbi:hypothetical protein NIES267_35070 [Calothrix parasitica NIES-267]|uniref:Uncharacterized protein n=1 Tax=Calothrix parasitica NIES-267 TaxID=1973488 RepID=A0A1Z4LRY3_9CYAN|nr:hypothetical protein NIES267_35070 [Calothrix parasitica NIES-267]